MRLPVGLVRRSGKRLGQALAGAYAKLRGGRLGRAAAGVLAKHRRERIGQAVVVALIVLLGCGTVGALALLPPDPRDLPGERAVAAVVPVSRVAVGHL